MYEELPDIPERVYRTAVETGYIVFILNRLKTSLSLFLLFHIFLFEKIKSIKSKIGFLSIVIITCLLSIHYFNNMFYLILPFLILEGNKNTRQIEQQI